MNFAMIEGATRVLGKPEGWDDKKIECGRLAILDTHIDGIPCMISEWEPSPEEIGRMMCGGRVRLYVAGTVHPPVSIQVGVPR